MDLGTVDAPGSECGLESDHAPRDEAIERASRHRETRETNCHTTRKAVGSDD